MKENEKDSIDRELHNLLSVDPPTGFQERVRAHACRQSESFSWSLRWALAAAAVVATIVAAVLVFRPQRVRNTEVAVTASRSATPPPVVEPSPKSELAAHHRAVKPAKAEPQMIIAAGESSAMRRLFSGEITQLAPAFQPEVREFQTPETVIEPLQPPAAVTIDPIEPLVPVGQ